VALEESFSDLVKTWRQLHENVQALRITAVEDQPADGRVLLVERCADATEDLLGWTAEGLSTAADAFQTILAAIDLNRARRSLTTSQQRFGCAEDQLFTIVSYQSLSELSEFGRARGGEWLGWVNSVRDAAQQCEQPIKRLRDALIRCWQELAERAAAASLSVHTTNIGQQFSTAPAKLKQASRATTRAPG
jgi:hypothetical protein